MLLALLFVLTKCDPCQDFTLVLSINLNNNSDYYYFDPNTHINSGLAITNQNYKNFIQDNIQCTGKWCVNGKWIRNISSESYYEVQHIIPIKNNIVELTNCSLNLMCNLIMANNVWNRQLSSRDNTFYGIDFVKSVYSCLYRECYRTEPGYYPSELCLPKSRLTSILDTLYPFYLVIILTVIITISIYRKYNK